jgi:hypothetical protein
LPVSPRPNSPPQKKNNKFLLQGLLLVEIWV